MKKNWFLFLGLLLFATSVAVQAQYAYTTNTDGTLTITNYTGIGGVVTLPTNFNGSVVADIGSNAFYTNTSLTAVTIPGTIVSIGVQAFFGCSNLTNIIISNSVTNMENGAFEECISLPDFVIPNSVSNINSDEFEYCISLTNVVIPTSVTSIADAAFFGCSKLGTIIIPGSVTNIENAAFYSCTSLTNITIPNSVTGLGTEVFEYCVSLTNIVIPDSVTNIGFGAFSYASNLSSIVVPASVTNIGSYAFIDCSSLSNIVIPASVTNIGSNAFQACTNLTTVSFTGNAPVVGSNVFDSDTNVTIYYLPGATGFGTNFAGSTTALAPAGSVQVIITPNAVVTAGAQWQLDGRTLQSNGVTINNLAVGAHIVSFSAVSNWITPASQTVTVSSDTTATATGLYVPDTTPKNGLTLLTNGLGAIQHSAWPQHLALTKKYSVTAVPKPGNLFAYWLGGTNAPYTNMGSLAHLPFTMASNLLLEANFVTNSFLATHGTYRSLFAPTNVPRQQTNSGSFTFNVSTGGAISGNLDLGGQMVPLNGKFGYDGFVQLTPKRPHGEASLLMTLQLDFTNESVTGSVSNGGFTAELSGDLDVFTGKNKATNDKGRYTLIIPGTNNPSVGPFGVSYATVTVNALGNITMAGSLADGTPFTESSVVSKDGRWPLYVKLYGGEGSLWGWTYFTNQTIAAIPSLSWINVMNPSKAAAYRSGFTNQEATLSGGIYVTGGTSPSGTLTLQANGAGFPVTLTNVSDNTNKLTLKTNKTTGVVNGGFANPADPQKTLKFKGVILQGQANAEGYFIDTNQSGSFILGPP